MHTSKHINQMYIMIYLGGHCASYQLAGTQTGAARYSETERGSLPHPMTKPIFHIKYQYAHAHSIFCRVFLNNYYCNHENHENKCFQIKNQNQI